MEQTPSPDKGPSEKKEKSPKINVLAFFDRYRARPDIPKYSYKEQSELAKKSEEARNRFSEEATPEAREASEAAARRFLESKEDKKHVSTIWAPLAAAQYFLRSEDAKEISETVRTELLQKIDQIMVKLEEARKQEHISDELVSEVLAFMNEAENQLNK